MYIFCKPMECRQPSLSFTISQSLLKLMSIEFMMTPNRLVLCHPLLLLLPPAPGGQSIGASGLASVLPMNIQGWFPFGLTGLISLPSRGLSRVFCSTTIWKHQFFATPWTMHTRLLCPSLSPRVCSNSCSLSQWCHPIISTSVTRFSSCTQSFPASESFPMS